jgi:hypothetical protein
MLARAILMVYLNLNNNSCLSILATAILTVFLFLSFYDGQGYVDGLPDSE